MAVIVPIGNLDVIVIAIVLAGDIPLVLLARCVRAIKLPLLARKDISLRNLGTAGNPATGGHNRAALLIGRKLAVKRGSTVVIVARNTATRRGGLIF